MVAAALTVCPVTDERLAELSGLAVVDGGVWAVDDGGREVRVHRLDGCEIVETRTADVDPYDVEDLAVGPDGSLWLADTGDNERDRETVAVIVLEPGGGARLHRLAYPDGPHDAEALLVDAAGVPHVVTKEAGGVAGIYRPAAPPEGTGPTPLVRAGEVVLPVSDTEGGPLGSIGTRTVTGAAAGPGVVALRTYTDAWLFPAGPDLVAALSGDPVRVPLPDEPQGEAIAFTADGTLLSASEARGGRDGELRSVAGAAGLVAAAPSDAPDAPAAVPAPDPDWLPGLVGAGVLGGVLVLGGAALAWRARR